VIGAKATSGGGRPKRPSLGNQTQESLTNEVQAGQLQPTSLSKRMPRPRLPNIPQARSLKKTDNMSHVKCHRGTCAASSVTASIPLENPGDLRGKKLATTEPSFCQHSSPGLQDQVEAVSLAKKENQA